MVPTCAPKWKCAKGKEHTSKFSYLHGFVKFVSKEERLVLDTLNNGHKHVHGVAELDMTERLSLSFIDVAHESMDCPLSLSLNPSDYSTLVL